MERREPGTPVAPAMAWTRVRCFGGGGLRWKTLIPFFLQSLRERTAPDVLLIHCGGNDLGRLEAVEVSAAMKQDLQYLHRKFPAMLIVCTPTSTRDAGGGLTVRGS